MPPQIVILLIQAGLTYGPQIVADIAAIFQKGEAATVADVQAAFANLKPYAAYNINPPGTLLSTGPATHA